MQNDRYLNMEQFEKVAAGRLISYQLDDVEEQSKERIMIVYFCIQILAPFSW